MKWKIKEASFNEDTGISYVEIETELGNFSGKSYLHEEDKDIASHFEGCRYAELRALIKYIKAHIRKQQIKVDTINNIINNMEQLKDYDPDNHEARFIRKQYYLELAKCNKLKEILSTIEERLITDMKGYRKLHEEYMEKINKKDK